MTATEVPLKTIATVRVSNVDKKIVDGEIPIRLCNYTDVYYNDQINAGMELMSATATPEQIRSFGIQPNDIIITKDSETANDIGVPSYVTSSTGDMVCGYHLAIIRLDDRRMNPRFLYWALASDYLRGQFTVAATGVTRFGLRSSSISNALVPLRSVSMQISVAEFLDTETARIDALIAKKKRLGELLLMYLGEARDAIAWSECTDSVALMHYTERGRPIMYGIVLPGPSVDDGVFIVKGGDVAADFYRSLCKTTREIESAYTRSRLRTGDLVFAIRGGIGDVAEVPLSADGANITQDVARVAPGGRTNARWLCHVLKSPRFQHQAAARITGATIRGLNIWDLKRLDVPYVSLDIQDAGARRLDAVENRIDELRKKLDAQGKLLREHRQALITAAVTGEMEVPGGSRAG